jgi:hypothetical protein
MKCIAFMLSCVTIALGATALPFLPGGYDAISMPLSGLARGVGLGSLLLVPIGPVWLFYEWRRKVDGKHGSRAGFVAATLTAGSLAVLVGALVAHSLSGASLAASSLVVWGMALCRCGPRWLDWSRRPRGPDFGAGLALILVPLIVVGSQLAMAPSLTSYAWNRTMDGLAPLIADIERYRGTNGHYPRSLFSEWKDYRPAVMGVSGYQYEPSGDAYNLAVEVPTLSFDSREFLLYNPADSHAMTSHDADLLQRTAAELVHYRGYFRARALDRPHWKVLSFD